MSSIVKKEVEVVSSSKSLQNSDDIGSRPCSVNQLPTSFAAISSESPAVASPKVEPFVTASPKPAYSAASTIVSGFCLNSF